ncbi:hypothetical protein PC117_g25771 [Phytophthora cactorum]|uniref:Uncharacterized protein n=1 Tax=Phytophthora cactorum TaxID=29920 RepID=A0A8T1APZ3_9STRA|nr:hypothetical protein PC117_g25771 [Phytophthora cactorum]
MNAYGSEEDSDTETGTHRGGDIACQPTVIRTLDRQLALDDQTRRVELAVTYPQHSEWSGDTVNGQPTVANFNNATTATTVTGSVGVTTSTGTGTTGTTPTIAAAAPDAVPAPTTTRTGNCSTPAAGSAPAPDGVTAPMAMMQQLVTTVGDLGLRLNNLQTARTGAATSHQASAAPGPSTYQATTMRATPSTTTRAGLGTDVTACAVVPTTSIPQQKNAKELDLQPFKPIAGGVRVEAWIAKVDLAVEGARISGRGDWSDEELYYVVGNKLQDVAAKSWVQIHKELARHERTWTKLKEALVRRNDLYGTANLSDRFYSVSCVYKWKTITSPPPVSVEGEANLQEPLLQRQASHRPQIIANRTQPYFGFGNCAGPSTSFFKGGVSAASSI